MLSAIRSSLVIKMYPPTCVMCNKKKSPYSIINFIVSCYVCVFSVRVYMRRPTRSVLGPLRAHKSSTTVPTTVCRIEIMYFARNCLVCDMFVIKFPLCNCAKPAHLAEVRHFITVQWMSPKTLRSGRGSNSRPSACEADVITATPPDQRWH